MMLQDRTWLLIGRKMAAEASPQELKELEEILRHNPELHFSLQALTEFWQQSPAANNAEIEEAYQKHLAKMQSELEDHPGSAEDFVENSTLFPAAERSFFRRNALALSSLTAILILVAGAIFYSIPPKTGIAGIKSVVEASEISTRNGSRTDIVLPDGTKVWLNAGSKITYDKTFGETLRNITLTGEAYFDVVHNAEKPFVIHTTAMDIKVLGTEFNVKSYPDESTTEASLIRGSIEVTLKDKRAEKIVMKPSEKLVVSNEEIVRSTRSVPVQRALKYSDPIISLGHLNYFSLDSTILETSWVSNRLIFEDESFEQVATRMSRWYGVSFDFGDDSIRNLRFTGNFKNESIEEALKAMQITADFSFRISSDKHVLITKKLN
jgi:transmembrane sensor